MSEIDERPPATHARRIGRYANTFKIGFNAFELVIEFGEQFSDGEAIQVHTRVVTNPIYAQALLRTLHETLREYEQSYSCADSGRSASETS